MFFLDQAHEAADRFGIVRDGWVLIPAQIVSPKHLT